MILKGEFVYLLVHSRGGDSVKFHLVVLTYPNSLDYRPDIDNLSPVQVGSNSDLVAVYTMKFAKCLDCGGSPRHIWWLQLARRPDELQGLRSTTVSQ